MKQEGRVDGQAGRREYGGYLPLELRPGQEWFRTSERNIRRYNCGRTAIYAAARAARPAVSRFYVPSYVCHTVVEAIEQAGLSVERYAVNEALEPAGPVGTGAPDEGVLLVNYFGLKDGFLQQAAQTYPRLLLDCTQAFFFPPVLRSGVRNVYSCRKFVGVPQGAYLVEQDTRAEQLRPGSGWEDYAYLCKAHELGTNAAYPDSLENERRLGERKEGMSPLTRQFLAGVDYPAIARRRRENFETMHRLLGEVNRLSLWEGTGVPQCYPFWAPHGLGQPLKERLLERRVYIPTLWKECRDICDAASLEVELTNDLLCLPIDQRYTEEDMELLAATVRELMGGWSR